METVILEDRVRRNLRKLQAIYTQEEIATFAGVSRVQINRIINSDGEPRLRTCETLAKSLHWQPAALFLSAQEFDELIKDLSVTSA